MGAAKRAKVEISISSLIRASLTRLESYATKRNRPTNLLIRQIATILPDVIR